jgi:hypothetical protein
MLDKLLTGDAIWFGVPALVGTLLFILRMVFMLFGGHGADLHHDVPDTSVADTDGHDTAGAFKALSLQTFMAFFMGFGWGGILGKYTLHKDFGFSMLIGVCCGVLMVWLLAVMLKATLELQSSGNVRLEQAVGAEGDVYVQVPPKGQGSGQVRVVLKDRMRIVNAQSEGEGVATASRVRVIRVNDDNSVTIAPV